MSHSHSKLYLCKVCNWNDYYPETRVIETTDGDAKMHKYIMICPSCNNDIKVEK